MSSQAAGIVLDQTFANAADKKPYARKILADVLGIPHVYETLADQAAGSKCSCHQNNSHGCAAPPGKPHLKSASGDCQPFSSLRTTGNRKGNIEAHSGYKTLYGACDNIVECILSDEPEGFMTENIIRWRSCVGVNFMQRFIDLVMSLVSRDTGRPIFRGYCVIEQNPLRAGLAKLIRERPTV